MPVKYGLAIAWFVTFWLKKDWLINSYRHSHCQIQNLKPEPEPKTLALCPVYYFIHLIMLHTYNK